MTLDIYWYESAWEFDSNARIVASVIVRDETQDDADDQLVQIFEGLRDGVDAIARKFIAKAEEVCASVGGENYDRRLGDVIEYVCVMPAHAGCE